MGINLTLKNYVWGWSRFLWAQLGAKFLLYDRAMAHSRSINTSHWCFLICKTQQPATINKKQQIKLQNSNDIGSGNWIKARGNKQNGRNKKRKEINSTSAAILRSEHESFITFWCYCLFKERQSRSHPPRRLRADRYWSISIPSEFIVCIRSVILSSASTMSTNSNIFQIQTKPKTVSADMAYIFRIPYRMLMYTDFNLAKC